MAFGIKANQKNDQMIFELMDYVTRAKIDAKQQSAQEQLHKSIVLEKSQFEDELEVLPIQKPIYELQDSVEVVDIEQQQLEDTRQPLQWATGELRESRLQSEAINIMTQNENPKYEIQHLMEDDLEKQNALQQLIEVVNTHRNNIKKQLRRAANNAQHKFQRTSQSLVTELPKNVRDEKVIL